MKAFPLSAPTSEAISFWSSHSNRTTTFKCWRPLTKPNEEYFDGPHRLWVWKNGTRKSDFVQKMKFRRRKNVSHQMSFSSVPIGFVFYWANDNLLEIDKWFKMWTNRREQINGMNENIVIFAKEKSENAILTLNYICQRIVFFHVSSPANGRSISTRNCIATIDRIIGSRFRCSILPFVSSLCEWKNWPKLGVSVTS